MRWKTWTLLCTAFLLAVLAWGAHRTAATDSKIWTTRTFLDFVEGEFGDGGANTYVSADGGVRLINLYDLNNDGNVDVVFPSTHDNNEAIPLFVYWQKSTFNSTERTALPTQGAKAVAIGDL